MFIVIIGWNDMIWICWVQLNVTLKFNFICSFLIYLMWLLKNLNCKYGSYLWFVFFFFFFEFSQMCSISTAQHCSKFSLLSYLTHALGVKCLLHEMILGSQIPALFSEIQTHISNGLLALSQITTSSLAGQ